MIRDPSARRVFAATLAVVLLLAATSLVVDARGQTARPLELWPLQSATLAPDGGSLTIDAHLRSAPSCYDLDHVETEVDGTELVVSVWYRGPADNRFCQTPCPLDTEPITIEFDAPVDPGLTVVADAGTPSHCSAVLADR